MGFPAFWADAVVAMRDELTAAARVANAVLMIVRREERIIGYLSRKTDDLFCLSMIFSENRFPLFRIML